MTSELEKVGNGKLVKNYANLLPDDYKSNVDSSDVILPRLKLVGGSTKDKGEATDGDYINSVSGVNYGKTIKIVTIYHWKPRIMFEDMVMKCRSFDGKVGSNGEHAGTLCSKCPESPWVDDAPPKCMLIYAYAVAEMGELEQAINNKEVLSPLIFSMSKTATPTAKIINSNILTNETRKIPIFVNAYELTHVIKTAKGKEFPVPKVKILNTVKDMATCLYLKEFYLRIRSMKIDVSEEDVGQGGEKNVTSEGSDSVDTNSELKL
jgi:hypothetical protein